MSSDAAVFMERVSEADRAALRAIGTRRRFPSGATLFMVGDEANEVLVILEGQAKASILASDGREVILSVLTEGSLLGEVAAIDAGPRSASVQALGDIEVLAIRSEVFDEFLLEHPAVLRDLARTLARRLRVSSIHQLEYGTGDSLSRVCRRLLELADRHGLSNADASITFESPLNQTELGSWAGLSREAVVKSMRSLRRLGWIRNEGKAITLVAVDEMRRRADE